MILKLKTLTINKTIKTVKLAFVGWLNYSELLKKKYFFKIVYFFQVKRVFNFDRRITLYTNIYMCTIEPLATHIIV